MSAELADRNIRVNALSPGPTDTEMFGRVPGEKEGEAIKDVLRTYNPSKRIAGPLEIAKLAVYLATDDSAYVVGQTSPSTAELGPFLHSAADSPRDSKVATQARLACSVAEVRSSLGVIILSLTVGIVSRTVSFGD